MRLRRSGAGCPFHWFMRNSVGHAGLHCTRVHPDSDCWGMPVRQTSDSWSSLANMKLNETWRIFTTKSTKSWNASSRSQYANICSLGQQCRVTEGLFFEKIRTCRDHCDLVVDSGHLWTSTLWRTWWKLLERSGTASKERWPQNWRPSALAGKMQRQCNLTRTVMPSARWCPVHGDIVTALACWIKISVYLASDSL